MRSWVWVVALLHVAVVCCGAGRRERSTPSEVERPITIVVPSGAGGFTDQLTRIVADELQEPLQERIVIVNKPGASGSVGTKNVQNASHDGYTWAAGTAANLGTFKILGLLDTSWEDWILYLIVADVPVVAVNRESPYQTFGDLLQAFRERPGQVRVATAGRFSSGHHAIEAIRRHTGAEYLHVPLDGANAAILACVAGETEVVTQHALEQSDMFAAAKLRPLAVLNDIPLELKGYGWIPPITNWIPEFRPVLEYYGIWILKDTPGEITAAVGDLWDTIITGSQQLQDYAAQRGAVFDPCWGEEAQAKAQPFLRQYAWSLYDTGAARISPTQAGIEKPQRE